MNRQYKLALLGDTCSGKTSILKNMMGEQWNSNLAMTIGIDFVQKRETVGDMIYEYEIFDTSGVPKFNCIVQQFLKQSIPPINGVIICIDINNPDYNLQIMNWKSMLAECLLDIPIIIAANKADLNHNPIKISQFQDIPIIKTSAKTGENIKQLLTNMLQLIRQRRNSVRHQNKEKEKYICNFLCCKI